MNPIDITRRSFLQTVLGTAAAVAVGGVALGPRAAHKAIEGGREIVSGVKPYLSRGNVYRVLCSSETTGRRE